MYGKPKPLTSLEHTDMFCECQGDEGLKVVPVGPPLVPSRTEGRLAEMLLGCSILVS